jgi:hypothetical protein
MKKRGNAMPVGKELGKYKGTFTSVRVCERSGEEQIVEGSYTGKVSGDLSGTAVGTMRFSGSNERGTLTDLGSGFLDSGDVTPYNAHGVYWASSQGSWETRAAAIMGDQTLVVEGQITMSDGVFSLKGKVFQLT